MLFRNDDNGNTILHKTSLDLSLQKRQTASCVFMLLPYLPYVFGHLNSLLYMF